MNEAPTGRSTRLARVYGERQRVSAVVSTTLSGSLSLIRGIPMGSCLY